MHKIATKKIDRASEKAAKETVNTFTNGCRISYIHSSLQTFRRDNDLTSHTTYVVCVNLLYMSVGTYSSKVILDKRFVRNCRVFARNLLRGNR